jgi:hypothetical protein
VELHELGAQLLGGQEAAAFIEVAGIGIVDGAGNMACCRIDWLDFAAVALRRA